jgi:hypothetical protein
MQAKSLGAIKTTTAGTPVQVTADATIKAARIRFQAIQGNTGKVFLGVASLNKGTFANAIAEFAIPGSAQPPDVTIDSVDGSNSLVLAEYWVDSNVNAEGFIVSYWVR